VRVGILGEVHFTTLEGKKKKKGRERETGRYGRRRGKRVEPGKPTKIEVSEGQGEDRPRCGLMLVSSAARSW